MKNFTACILLRHKQGFVLSLYMLAKILFYYSFIAARFSKLGKSVDGRHLSVCLSVLSDPCLTLNISRERKGQARDRQVDRQTTSTNA